MDTERLLLSRVLLDRDLTPLLQMGISPKHFDDGENRTVLTFALEHLRMHGQSPGVKTLRLNFPNYEILDADEPVSYYLEEVCNSWTHSKMVLGLQDIADQLSDRQVDVAKGELLRLVSEVGQEFSKDVDSDVTETGDNRVDRYVKMQDLDGGLLGIPTGFVGIDMATMGLQPGHLVTLIGPAKAGKTSILLKMARAAQMDGKVCFVVSFEMSENEITARFDAMLAGISHWRLQAGRFNKFELRKLEEALDANADDAPFILSTNTAQTMTVSGIAAKIREHDPDVVFIDGVYFMEDERGEARGSPQALTNITRDMKSLARQAKIPLVITTQALEWKINRKKGLTAGAAGYSSSFVQDSNVVLGVERDDEDGDDVVKLRVLESRNGPRVTSKVRINWDTGQIEELKSDWLEPEPPDETEKAQDDSELSRRRSRRTGRSGY